MKISYLFHNDIQKNVKRDYITSMEFKEDLILQNICRGELMVIVSIAFEIIFMIIDIISSINKVDKTFSFDFYLIMYCIMIVINLIYLFQIKCFYKNKINTRVMDFFTVFYITLIMVWGSIISLMDQKLYGHLTTFMVNMMICSVIYLLNAKIMSIPYLTATLILIIGLPFFQSSGDVLIGHYVNLFVFIVVAWIASRISYLNYCDNYVIRKLMNQSKSLLEKEMEEKKVINTMLEAANAQLKKIALVDQLTGLQNRHGYHEFREKMFQNINSGLTVSVIMIDVDNFKQYNDSYGHEKGDLALIAIAKQIDSMVESNDQIAVRWGGEEFIYIALNKSKQNILDIANALRHKIENLKIENSNRSITPYITISLGTCTETMTSEKDINKIIKTADRALYLAKSNGRNCVASLTYNEYSNNEAL